MGIRAICSAAMLVAVSAAQAQVSDQTAPTLHTSTRIVAVTIVATRSNGSPVADLRASDIRVFDDKKEQTIASFEAMEASSATTQVDEGISTTALPVATNYPHFFIILLMRLALEDSREGYLLTYTPKGFHEDRSFHTIRLRSIRPGVHFRFRSGYFAEPAQSLANAK